MKVKSKNLEEICRPIAEYLKNNYDPHCTIIITDTQIKLVRDEIGIPVETAHEVPVQEQSNRFFSSTSNGICYGPLIKKERTDEFKKVISPNWEAQNHIKQIYVLKFKLNKNEYFLTDLKGTLSKNIKDSLIIFDYNTANLIGGTIEYMIEQKIDIVASCDILQLAIPILF